MAVQLKEHQQKAVDKLSNGKILWGGVGSGKTITSLAYYWTKEMGGVLGDLGSLRKPKDLYIITTAKKRDTMDWQEDAAKLGITRDNTVSIEAITMTIDSWNNIGKYVDVEDAFFIFDEKKLEGTGAWVKAYHKICRKNNWIVLTATPGDVWLDYAAVFIANGWYKNITEFKREHVVYNNFSKYPKVDRYVGVARLVRLRNEILVEMPYERHTTRHLKHVKVDFDPWIYEKVVQARWHVYEERPIKNAGELFGVMRKVVNSDPSRTKALAELMDRHDRLIIFYNFDYELEALRKMVASQLLGIAKTGEYVRTFDVAEWNGHKHESIPKTKRWVYFVQYVAGAEGWNCVDTDAIAFYSLTYSYKNFEQAQGRIDRLNTPFKDLYYYILRSDASIDRGVWKSLKEKRNFNEKAFAQNVRF